MMSARLLFTVALAACALAAAAQPYKVVGPDGKVTYTDRPPATTTGKVSTVGARSAAPVATEVALPLALREPASKYPATLYTASGACDPCDGARLMLRQRGIPFAEKQVFTPEDNDALARISGGRDVPVLTLGPQTLRGFAPDTWGQYLDAAGYPRESRLPANYQYPAPTPVAPRAATATAAATNERPAAPTAPQAPAAAPPDQPAIRF